MQATAPSPPAARQPVDQLIIPRWLLPMDAAHSTLENHAMAVADGRIVAMGAAADLRARYHAAAEVTLAEHAVLPGFVNAHTHAAMTLLRGYADDLPLQTWLREHIWPVEGKWADAEFVEVGTDLALVEMIQSGTTCFGDMYLFPEIAAQRAERAGMRAAIGMIVIDIPTAWAQNADDCIEQGLRLRDKTRHSPLISTAFAPHSPYMVAERALERIRTLADELDCRIHMHLHETRWEIAESVKRYGMRPLERLVRLQIASPRLTAVHMVHLLPEEIASLAQHGVTVAHCPQSNLKLGSGLCPLAKLMEAGVAIAIGTDGAASNNDLDMLSEMQTAALLAKGVSEDPTAMPAAVALEAATLGGARALGLDHLTGSLAPGKQADFIAVDLSAAATSPLYQPISHIVYAAARQQITDVWVAGARLMENRVLTTLEAADIIQKAAAFAKKIVGG